MGQNKFPLSEEECLRIGGHCWARSDFVYDTNPPIYERYCKHCGKVQQGSEQPTIDWQDVKRGE